MLNAFLFLDYWVQVVQSDKKIVRYVNFVCGGKKFEISFI